MKKFVYLLLAICIVVSVSACGGSSKKQEQNSVPEDTEDTTSESTERQEQSDVQDNMTSEPTERKERNGFQETTNFECSLGGFRFSVPSYYGTPDIESEDERLYRAEATDDALAMLSFVYNDVSSWDAAYFENNKKQLIQEIADGIENGDLLFAENLEIPGVLGVKGKFTGVVDGNNMEALCCLLYNSDTGAEMTVISAQTDGAKYSYFDDFEKIIFSCTLE